jgi:hypothetical protein
VTDPTVAVLWLDLLGKIAGPAAHAVNNALNNVAINLALVQARANSPNAAAYAERADGYLTEATRLAQAVMALSRPVPVPVEPASVLHQLVPVLRATDRVIEMHDDIAHVVSTPIDGAVVRLALAAALSGSAVSRIHVLRGGEEMQISGGALPDDVADAARRAGVGLRLELGQVTFTFT